jgi:hypothetical protein
MNITKQAAKDAAEWVRSDMFYGEGAGTRRHLIDTIVVSRKQKLPGYAEAFEKAVSQQDWADHAVKAMAERKRLDMGKGLKRNLRGVLTGNKRSLTTGVVTALTVYSILHETGLDKPIIAGAKQTGRAVKLEYTILKARIQGRKNNSESILREV